MDTYFASLALFAHLFFLFRFACVDSRRSRGPVVYSRDQLIAVCSTAVLSTERPDDPRGKDGGAGAERRVRRR